MSDNRLGISVGISGDGELTRLEGKIKSLRESINALGTAGQGSSNFALNLSGQLQAAETQLQRLKSTFVSTYASIDSFNIRAIAAMHGQSDAIKGVAREMTSLDAITRAGANGTRLYTQSVRDAIAVTTGLTNARNTALQHAERQKQLDQSFAHGTTPTASSVNFTAATRNTQELERIRQMSARSAGAAAVQHMSLQEALDKSFGIGQAASIAEAEVQTAFGRMRCTAGEAGEASGRGFWFRFMRGGRTPMSLFDEGARGQRGQMLSTVGAGFRASGIGGAGTTALMGGVFALGAIEAIRREAEALGKWAEQVRAGAAATGMSVPQYSQLQGALVLTGAKAESADAAMRMFANNLEKAMSNPAARSAKALHALGISQDEIRAKGGDVMLMFSRIADQWNKYANGATKSAAGEALFGRSLEEVTRLLERGSDGTQQLMKQAQALGITLDDNTAAALANTGDKLIALGQKITGEVIQAFIQWKPEIDSAIGALNAASTTIGTLIGWLGQLDSALSASGGLFGAFMATAIPGYGFMKGATDWLKANPQRVLTGAKAFFGGSSAAGGPGQHELTLPDVSVHPGWAGSGLEGSPIGGPSSAKPHVQAFDQPKAHAANHKLQNAQLSTLREQLQQVRREYELQSAAQDANFQKSRLQAGIQQADKNISPVARAQEDVNAYKAAEVQKEAALTNLHAQSDSIYNQMLATIKGNGAVEVEERKKINEQKLAADTEYTTKAVELQSRVLEKTQELVTAHKQAVQQVVAEWGSAFDSIGANLESTIGTAIKSAFEPMKPEYWWSSVQGPHGQPLMQSHRIDPTTQLLGQFGMSALGDLGKTFMSSITASVGKSIFGEGTSSLGQGLAKALGIGGPGGLFGTGLGAVKSISTEATMATSTTAFATSVTAFASAVATFTGSVATMSASSAAGGAGSAASAVGGAGGFLGFLGKIPLIGGLFGGASAAGGAAAGAGSAAEAALAFASGGWDVPSFAGGGWNIAGGLSMLHPKEMVLPAHLAQGVRSMVANGGSSGGDNHLHLHAAAMDAPSMDRWFRSLMAQNPNSVKNLFRNNALTPRTF